MQQIEAEKIAEAYGKLKAKLTDREQEVITRYYGIGHQVRNTLAEIGETYGVTRERVRQIKAVALGKLKIKVK